MVAAKKIQVSSDNITFYTLPGNTGQLQDESGVLDDTVFNQSYKSSQPGLLMWQMSSQAFYKGFAGYVATLKMTGTSTSMTSEACALVSGKTYQITNTAKRVIDPAVAVVVRDGVTDVTANVISIDYLFGKVTFSAGYTVVGAITIFSGNYLPLATVASMKGFTLTQTADATDISDYATVQANSGYRVFQQGLKSIAVELKGFYNVSNAILTKLEARSLLVLEICPDGGALSVARGFFKIASDSYQGNVGAVEEDSIKLNCFVYDPSATPLMASPFTWSHAAGTTLSQAVQVVLNGFLNGTTVYMKYLQDGTNGKSGSGIITEATLSGGVDAMNSFSVTLQGSAGIAAVGTG